MTDTQQEFKNTIARLGVDLDVFDFYRMDNPHGYAMTVCPSCSEQADVHRKPNGVKLICTKCPTEAEWECNAEDTAYGSTGSIRLVRVSLGPTAMTDNIPTKPITINLVETNCFTRWPCTVCGGCTEKVAILAEGTQPLSDDGEHRKIRVCETCLEEDDVDSTLEQHAASLEARR